MIAYAAIAVLVWSAVLGATSYHYGSKHEHDAVGAEQKAAQDKAIKEHNENAAIDMQAAYEVGQKQAQVRVVTQTIREQVDRVVEKPVYRDCRLDDDGLRLWNAANAGQLEAPAASKPAAALPGAAKPKLPDIR